MRQVHQLTGMGVKQVGNPGKLNAEPPPFTGRHLWTYVGMWEVKNPARDQQTFDMENLILVMGPGCYWCEQVWTSTIGARCSGESSAAPKPGAE